MPPQTPEPGETQWPLATPGEGGRDDESPQEAWQACFGRPVLTAADIHVWRVSLRQPSEVYEACRSLLAPDERERADRFRFDRHREQFTVARGALRSVLGLHLREEPGRLRFVYSPFGKPSLEGVEGEGRLCFNLSHTEEIALIALALGREVGVDVEVVREEFAGLEIAERFFSAREVETLRSMPAEARTETFFLYWTRKEAYIKALGEGLSHPLQQFTVSLGEGESSVLVEQAGTAPQASPWKVKGLSVGRRHAAAVAFHSHVENFRFWHWDATALVNVLRDHQGRDSGDRRQT